MKKILTLAFMLFAIVILKAQAPQAIPYQAVARDNNGNLLPNQNINMRFSVHEGSAGGSIVYQETQPATTSSLGLFSLNLGQGTITNAYIAFQFSSINWNNGSKFLQTEMDPTGGNNFINMGTTQMMSVPYALSAGSSADNQWSVLGNGIYNNNSSKVIIVDTLDVLGTIGIYDPASTNSDDITIGRGGVITDANPRFVLSERADNTELWLYGNGADYKNFVSFDYANYKVNFPAGSNTLVVDESTGNVGIGTATPANTLDVVGGIGVHNNPSINTDDITIAREGAITDANPRFVFSERNDNTELWLYGNGASFKNFVSFDYANNKVNFPAGSNTLVVDESAGNVGIGTSIPLATLDVEGTVKINDGSAGQGKILTCTAGGYASWQPPGSTHFVGESYGGGIVFFVYDNGQHGLIASTADQSPGITWSNGTDRNTGTFRDGVSAGAMNTSMIITAEVSDNPTGNFAALSCSAYYVTVSGVKYGDWYLPSIFELNLLYQEQLLHDYVPGFSGGTYWSSTMGAYMPYVRILNFSNGLESVDVGSAGYGIRAIRSF